MYLESKYSIQQSTMNNEIRFDENLLACKQRPMAQTNIVNLNIVREWTFLWVALAYTQLETLFQFPTELISSK